MKLNKRGYAHYVFLPAGRCIESGWEYRSDANDQAVALGSAADAKVYTRTGLRRMRGLDPDRDGDWCGLRNLKPFS